MELFPSCWGPILNDAAGRKGRSIERVAVESCLSSWQSHFFHQITPGRVKESLWLHSFIQPHGASAGLDEGQPDASVFVAGPATLVPFQSYLLTNLDTSLSIPKACWTSEKFNFFSDEVHSDEFQLIGANKQSQSLKCTGGCLTGFVLFIIGKPATC